MQKRFAQCNITHLQGFGTFHDEDSIQINEIKFLKPHTSLLPLVVSLLFQTYPVKNHTIDSNRFFCPDLNSLKKWPLLAVAISV